MTMTREEIETLGRAYQQAIKDAVAEQSVAAAKKLAAARDAYMVAYEDYNAGRRPAGRIIHRDGEVCRVCHRSEDVRAGRVDIVGNGRKAPPPPKTRRPPALDDVATDRRRRENLSPTRGNGRGDRRYTDAHYTDCEECGERCTRNKTGPSLCFACSRKRKRHAI